MRARLLSQPTSHITHPRTVLMWELRRSYFIHAARKSESLPLDLANANIAGGAFVEATRPGKACFDGSRIFDSRVLLDT